MRISGQMVSNPGNVRSNNEDSVRLLSELGPRSPLPLVVGLVADGMGGHEGGEVASQLAADLVPAAIFASRLPVPEALRDAIAAANREIYRASRKDSAHNGMGTTIAVAAVQDDDAWFGWVGDSRIYLLRGFESYQVSSDHTLVAELVRSGHMTPEEARHHEDRNVLSRALGTKPRVEVDVTCKPLRLQPGDRLLLCSDGIHDLVTDREIAACCGAGEPARSIAGLVGLALERGGYDNASAVLLVAGEASTSGPVTREVLTAC